MLRLVLQNPGSGKKKKEKNQSSRQPCATASFLPFPKRENNGKSGKGENHHEPLNMTGLHSATTPTYPVSSLNSRTALSAALSPSSTSPAGTSITTFPTGGRNCFWRTSSGPVGFARMATIPTPSMGEDLGRVCFEGEGESLGSESQEVIFFYL